MFAITDEAIQTFREEWGVQEGQYVRIYLKYAGGGNDAFSVGLNVSAEPIDPSIVKSFGGIHFFIEKSDDWIMREYKLKIDSKHNEIFFASN